MEDHLVSNLSDFYPVNGVDTNKTMYQQVFTSSGTFTPASGVTRVYVKMSGSGGGGGGYNPSSQANGTFGGAAQMVELWVAVSGVITVTIGSGGSGGASGSPSYNGLKGGTSSFGLISASGGSGGMGLSHYSFPAANPSQISNGYTGVNGGTGGIYNTSTAAGSGESGFCIVTWWI